MNQKVEKGWAKVNKSMYKKSPTEGPKNANTKITHFKEA